MKDKEQHVGELKKTVLRDNLESIAIAVLLVLFMRQVVVEAFKIPTGSMAPGLVGIHREIRCPDCGDTFRVGHDKVGTRGEIICPNCGKKWPGGSDTFVRDFDDETIVFQTPAWLWNRGHTALSRKNVSGLDAANRIDRWGSRIFVNKFIYKLRPPRRWELTVFDYPYGDKNYIKRLVGLPGETVSIREGNVYIDGEIARKPSAIQQEVWIPVLDTRWVGENGIGKWWQCVDGKRNWTVDNESGYLQLDATDSGSPVFAKYARPIRDFYAYNGIHNIDGRSGRNKVNDIKIEVDAVALETADEASIDFRIAGGDHYFHVEIPVGSARSAAEAALYKDGEKIKTSLVPEIEEGEEVSVAIERYDRTLVVRLDGKEKIRYLYGPARTKERYEQFVGIGAKGLKAKIKGVRLFRDIYYLPGTNDISGTEYFLDDDSYFMLGDNSPYSSDSREWENHRVPHDKLIGRAFAIFWPISDLRLIPSGKKEKHD